MPEGILFKFIEHDGEETLSILCLIDFETEGQVHGLQQVDFLPPKLGQLGGAGVAQPSGVGQYKNRSMRRKHWPKIRGGLLPRSSTSSRSTRRIRWILSECQPERLALAKVFFSLQDGFYVRKEMSLVKIEEGVLTYLNTNFETNRSDVAGSMKVKGHGCALSIQDANPESIHGRSIRPQMQKAFEQKLLPLLCSPFLVYINYYGNGYLGPHA